MTLAATPTHAAPENATMSTVRIADVIRETKAHHRASNGGDGLKIMHALDTVIDRLDRTVR
jgi:hypothetical protein